MANDQVAMTCSQLVAFEYWVVGIRSLALEFAGYTRRAGCDKIGSRQSDSLSRHERRQKSFRPAGKIIAAESNVVGAA